jgi:Major capsid protein N-terminus/Large eukaryotic DNA virus major capsid protein
MALVQLIAQGPQDELLTGRPQHSFFRSVYRRPTPFASEWKDQVFAGEATYGSRAVVKIGRLGDLVHNCMLQMTMKRTGPTLYPAEEFVKSVELWIGGQLIDTHTATFFRVYDELYRTEDARMAYRELTDFTTEDVGSVKTLYLPLVFFFCRDVSLSLPLVSLQYNDVELVFTFADRVDGVDPSVDPMPLLICEYFYLDNAERRLFAQSQREMLIEQLQMQEADVAAATDRQATHYIDVRFNHPVKTLAWVVAHPTKHGVFASSLAGLESAEVYGPLHSARLLIDGVERAEVRSGAWCRLVDAFSRARQIPSVGVYSMHFALRPESPTTPSGSLNLSRLSAVLAVTLKRAVPGVTVATRAQITDEAEETAEEATSLTHLRLFAQSWNLLSIRSGMAGLVWSN